MPAIVAGMHDLQSRIVPQLLRLHGDILEELRHRRILRSANGPSGDYGEHLFARAFGWTLQTNSSSGHDAVDADNIRYQIKCRRITPRNKSRQLSFIRNLPNRPFDILAGVLLDETFRVKRAALIPFEIVRTKAKFVEHVKAWRLMLQDSVWDIAEVKDVTNELRAVEDTI